MKKNVLLPLLWLLISIAPLSAKVIRVNNQETENKPDENSYKSILDGYNAAENGDTIYIEPSPIAYGDLTIEKRLVFIGGGYFHNQNEGLSANHMTSDIGGNWYFRLGSSSSKIIGLSFTTNHRGVFLNENGIEISNCRFRNNRSATMAGAPYPINLERANLENIAIIGCYFDAGGNNNTPIFNSTSRPLINLVFTNNISLRRVNLSNNSSGIFSNNLIQFNDFSIGLNSDFQIHNNIFLGTNSVELPTAAGNKFSHNLANTDKFGTANNNQANVPLTNIFIVSESLDGMYQIKENGPADGKGLNGDDIGPFGGANPYRLSGLPTIPIIYQLTTSGVANSEAKLPITIKVKAN